MASPFITENFLLQNDTAVELYHRFAKEMPIFDYHNHLPVRELAEDRSFENLTQLWLAGDHYKWRAMRAAGVSERFCTGDATDWEKFQAWAQVVPQTLRNPLYHWTHLELNRPFGINDRLLNPETAEGIWNECNGMLAKPEFSCRGILKQMNAVLVCTTDDPTDDLQYHRSLAADTSFPIKVLPTFRPDKALATGDPTQYNAWIEKLEGASGVEVKDDFARLLEALQQRHNYFHHLGCRLADHGVDTFYAESYETSEINMIFRRIRRGNDLRLHETYKLRSAILFELASMNHAQGWAQQFHFGAMRNNNSRMYQTLGPDTGFDSIGDALVGRAMSKFLSRLDSANKLARTVLYNINPAQNELVATMIGNFQDGSIPGKMQMGSGWWFLDQKEGMEKQLNALSNQGLLSRSIGMLTDSRSFLSFTRHEYYRRILCNLLGGEMEQGLLPREMELIGSMVQDVCYRNAARYFDFEISS